jgi:glycosyltransferase 2 family protein
MHAVFGDFYTMTSNGRSRRALLVTLFVGLPLSFVFLWLSIRDADLEAVWRTIGSARPLPLVAAVCLIGAMYALQARRWRRIAKASSLPQRQVLEMLVAGLAVNNVVPGRVGDLLRANWIARATGVPGGRGLASVVLDRGGDLVVLAASLFLGLPLVSHTAWVDRLVIGAGIVVAVFVLGLCAARLYIRRRGRPVSRQGLVRRLAHDTLAGLSEPMPTVDKLAVLGLSVAAWLAWSAAAIMCARSIGIEISLVEALFLAGVVNLGVAIPSSPGFVGTYQWLVISTLALYGVGRDEGLAFAVVFQACWYIPTTVVGGTLLAVRAPGRVRVPITVGPPAEQTARA